MKAIIILLIVLSTLMNGCASSDSETLKIETQEADENIIIEVDNTLIEEDEEIDIGDML